MTASLSETFQYLYLEWSIDDLAAARGSARAVELEVSSVDQLIGPNPLDGPRLSGQPEPCGRVHIDWAYVDGLTDATLERPIFIVTCPPGVRVPHLVADGHHRLALARRRGRHSVSALLFDIEASSSAMTERLLRYVAHLVG